MLDGEINALQGQRDAERLQLVDQLSKGMHGPEWYSHY